MIRSPSAGHTVRESASSKMLTSWLSPVASAFPERARAAARARLGHAPPARSAMANRISQPSCCRSPSASGRSGSDAASVIAQSEAHRAKRERSAPTSASYRTRRSRLTASCFSFRRMEIRTLRLATVSGRSPIPESAQGPNTSNALGSCSVPTHRSTVVPRRCPALSIARSSSMRSRERVSTSSRSKVGCAFSMLRKHDGWRNARRFERTPNQAAYNFEETALPALLRRPRNVQPG